MDVRLSDLNERILVVVAVRRYFILKLELRCGFWFLWNSSSLETYHYKERTFITAVATFDHEVNKFADEVGRANDGDGNAEKNGCSREPVGTVTRTMTGTTESDSLLPWIDTGKTANTSHFEKAFERREHWTYVTVVWVLLTELWKSGRYLEGSQMCTSCFRWTARWVLPDHPCILQGPLGATLSNKESLYRLELCNSFRRLVSTDRREPNNWNLLTEKGDCLLALLVINSAPNKSPTSNHSSAVERQEWEWPHLQKNNAAVMWRLKTSMYVCRQSKCRLIVWKVNV